MTVAAVEPTSAVGSEASTTADGTLPDGSFEGTLASVDATESASTDDPQGGGGAPRAHQLPTLTLGEMVSAIVEGPPPEALEPQRASGDVATAAQSADAWGVSAERPETAATGPGAAVLDAGEAYLGVPYKWGGTDPSVGFDCSGFVQQVYADLGIDLPRVSADQARAGEAVDGGLDAAQPGDLVFWRGGDSRPNHIGIYAGEGTMLVAPSSGDVVRYQEITRTPDAVRRVL